MDSITAFISLFLYPEYFHFEKVTQCFLYWRLNSGFHLPTLRDSSFIFAMQIIPWKIALRFRIFPEQT